MTNPSSEAMAAAEDVLRTMQESRGLEYADPIDEIELGLLTAALDDHTAALRAEVEALRAERDKYHEQVKMFQGAVLELLMVAEPDFSTKTFTVPFEEWDYLMSADRNAKDPNQKEIII